MSDRAFPVGVPDTQITDDSGQFSLDDLRATPEEAARLEALVAAANWLPDDMVERAARTQSTRWDSLTEETQDDIRSSVREILCAALAGRTVVDHSEPAKFGVLTATWHVPAHDPDIPPTAVDGTLWDEYGPIVTIRQARTLVVQFRPAEARGVLASLAAAIAHVEHLAAETADADPGGSQVGDQ